MLQMLGVILLGNPSSFLQNVRAGQYYLDLAANNVQSLCPSFWNNFVPNPARGDPWSQS